jgi:hypothetical protein
LLGLESEATGSRSWHLGATDVRSGGVLGSGPTQGPVFWRRQES